MNSSPQHSNTPALQSSIAILGLWHQGVVAAGCLADLGFTVTGADHDAGRIAGLRAGHAPLFEPGLDALLQKGLASGRLSFSALTADAVRGCPFVFLMFDTPVDDDDRSDLAGVFAAVEEIAPRIEEDAILLVTAQVPVGTCDELGARIRKIRPGLKFGMAYSPENLRLGQAIALYGNPALPVIGADDAAVFARLETLFSVLPVAWQRVSLRTAEMTKHALNTFLATSITLGNELGNLCDEVGADGRRMAEVLRLEPRIGARALLFPGLGFSGGTLARDLQTLRALGKERGLETRLLDGVWESNRRQNTLVVRKLNRQFGSLRGVTVAVLGLTYKPDTSTLRRSAALEIIGELGRAGAAIRAHDPKADREDLARHRGFCFCEDVYEAARGADVVVLITPWAEYKALDFPRLKEVVRKPILFDTANLWDSETLQRLGFAYLDIGRGRTV